MVYFLSAQGRLSEDDVVDLEVSSFQLKVFVGRKTSSQQSSYHSS